MSYDSLPQSIKDRIKVCEIYGTRGKFCNTKCPYLHVRQGIVRWGKGAEWVANNMGGEAVPPSTVMRAPHIRIDVTQALTGVLIQAGSDRWVSNVLEGQSTYTVSLESQPRDSVSSQVKLARSCRVERELGTSELVHAADSTDIPEPTFFMHACNSTLAIGDGLAILCNGLENSACEPHGVYSVAADTPQIEKKLGFYDSGVAVVFSSTGFIANISTKSSGGKDRENKYHWLTGAPVGVILFRRMTGLSEFIHNKQSTQVVKVAFDKEGLYSELQRRFEEPGGRDLMRQAHRARAKRNAQYSGRGEASSSTAVASSSNAEAISSRAPPWRASATPVADGPVPHVHQAKPALSLPCGVAVLQAKGDGRPRSRSRSRSDSRPPTLNKGCEIPFDFGNGRSMLKKWERNGNFTKSSDFPTPPWDRPRGFRQPPERPPPDPAGSFAKTHTYTDRRTVFVFGGLASDVLLAAAQVLPRDPSSASSSSRGGATAATLQDVLAHEAQEGRVTDLDNKRRRGGEAVARDEVKDKKGTGDKSATDMSMSGWLCANCEKSLEGGTKQKDYFKWHKKWYCKACYAIA